MRNVDPEGKVKVTGDQFPERVVYIHLDLSTALCSPRTANHWYSVYRTKRSIFYRLATRCPLRPRLAALGLPISLGLLEALSSGIFRVSAMKCLPDLKFFFYTLLGSTCKQNTAPSFFFFLKRDLAFYKPLSGVPW